jgi:phosphoglycerol transferase MdoB-like AlkP superfamily enzyme
MNPTLFLRIASVLTLIHCTLHTVGGVFGKPKHGAPEIAVIDTMKNQRFNFMGSMRGYHDFLFGYGLAITITLLVQGILFWQLGAAIKTDPGVVRPIVALFFVGCILTAIVSWKYFFIAPAITQLLIAACLALSFMMGAST